MTPDSPRPAAARDRTRPRRAERAADRVAQAVAQAAVQPALAIEHARRALADPSLSPTLRSDAQRAIAIASMQCGDLSGAQAALDDGIACARRASDPLREARCWCNLGIVHLSLGAVPDALDGFARALGLVEADSPVAAVVCGNVALVAEQFGADEIALAFADLAWSRLPPGPGKASAAVSAGAALCRLARLPAARERLQSALELLPDDPPSSARLDALGALAWIDGREGRTDAAIAALAAVCERADAAALHASGCRARMLLAETLLQAGRTEGAITLIEVLLPAAERIGENVVREARRVLARAYAAVGRWREAYGCLVAAGPAPQASMAIHEAFVLLRRLARASPSPSPTDGGDARPGSEAADEAMDRTVRTGAAVLARRHGLTDADLRLVRLLAGGSTNPEVAAALGVSVNTVRNRLARVMTRLGVRSRAAVVAKALESGLVVA